MYLFFIPIILWLMVFYILIRVAVTVIVVFAWLVGVIGYLVFMIVAAVINWVSGLFYD